MFPAMYAEAITLTQYGDISYVERDLEKFDNEFWRTLARRFARERALLYEKYEYGDAAAGIFSGGLTRKRRTGDVQDD